MKRILTAIVALPILLYTVWSPVPYFFVALTLAAILFALAEFYSLCSHTGARPYRAVGLFSALLIAASFVIERPVLTVAAVLISAVLALGYGVFRTGEISAALNSAAATVFGTVYVGLLGGCLIAVRLKALTHVCFPPCGYPNYIEVSNFGPKLLTTFFAMVMLTDTAAYYVGRAMGRHKLAPTISPGKTIEGAVGGLFGAMLAGPVCRMIFFPEITMLNAVILGLTVGVIGQIGDLAESLLKRSAGVKDSGTLLPGHGGMLDRIDSILFCAPVIYFYSQFLASTF
jgi:phosphatidate cytidylyltransferase